MKMFNYYAMGVLVLLIMLWAALLLDTGNMLHHMSETMHLIERTVKANAK